MQLINVRLAVGVNAKQKLNAAKVISIQSQAESALQNNGRVLLRASGTEPVVRVMVEAKSLVDCQHWATTIAETVAHA
jgi:phosphoglucosamine mutase